MKNVNESGRSMVEMLGVLAIIGVLSIGGIAGYTMAMNRYRANEGLAAANMAIVEAMAREADSFNYTSIGTLPAGVTSVTANGNANPATATVVYADEAVATVADEIGKDRVTCDGASCTVNSR